MTTQRGGRAGRYAELLAELAHARVEIRKYEQDRAEEVETELAQARERAEAAQGRLQRVQASAEHWWAEAERMLRRRPSLRIGPLPCPEEAPRDWAPSSGGIAQAYVALRGSLRWTPSGRTRHPDKAE